MQAGASELVDFGRCTKIYSMLVPHTQLVPATLRAVVSEFVTRDGTDHTSVENRIEAVLRQLEAGRVQLHFDEETKTCNIVQGC